MPFVDQVVNRITAPNYNNKDKDEERKIEFFWKGTKLRLSCLETHAQSFFDLTKTKPKTEAKTKAKVKTKTNNKVKIKEKTQNLWMPLTMLGGYESVVADLVERGVVKPRSLLS